MSYDFMDVGIDVSRAHGGPEVKTTCPACSHTRAKSTQKCLNVNLDTGVFFCHHCGHSGKAPEYGNKIAPVFPRVTQDRPKAYVKPEIKVEGLSEQALAWFAKRGITQEVLIRNGVTVSKVFMPQVSAEVTAVAFPYRKAGQVVNCKYRDHQKNFRMVSGAERALYGYDDMAETTVIVEGEIDKLSMEVAGYENCVSVPDGAPAPNTKNIESKFDFLNDEKLATVQKWIVAVDNDAPGLRLQEELIRRFGSEKCLTVTWPDGCKDANDVLVQYGAETLRKCVDNAKPLPIVGVFGADDFADDFMRMYDEGVPNGKTTGWDAVDEFWRVQLGQLLIVTGIPGHGKSEWVDALTVNLALDHGWSTAIYSPENWPINLHMMKFAEKYIGKPFNPGPHERMSRAESAKAKDWIADHFHWILPEKPSLDEIMAKARALVLQKGIRVLVIDPWNEIEHDRANGKTEAEYVSESLMKLRWFARKHEILLIVVAHPRLLEKKSDGTYPVPTPYDISGGAMWRNKADNCIAVYANPADPTGYVELHVQKVKFKLFGKVGMTQLTWDRPTGRYFERLPSSKGY